MANETIKLLLEVDTKNSLGSLNGLEERLGTLKERIKSVEVGSAAFKALQKEIVNSEAQVKNLNKSFEGLDTEALAGEFGKFAGGITAGFTAISAVGGKSMEEVVQSVAKGMAIMQGIKGATEAWTSAQKLLNVVLSMNPIGLIVMAIGALIAVIGVVIAKGDGIKKMLTEWGEKFTFLKAPIEVIKKGIDLLMNSWNKLSDAVKWAVSSDEDATKNIEKMREDFKKRQEQRHKDEVDRILEKKKMEKDLWGAATAENQKNSDEAKKLETERIENLKKANEEKLNAIKEYNRQVMEENYNRYMAELEAQQNKVDLENEAWEEANALDDERNAYDLEKRQIHFDSINDMLANQDASAAAFTQNDIDRTQAEINAILTKQNITKEDALLMEMLMKRLNNMEIKMAKEKAQRDKDQLQSTANYLGAVAGLFEENTAAYKIMASAQIIISGALAIMKTWEGYASMSVFGTIMAGIQTASIIALGISSLAKVNGVQFADGGVLNGPSHAQGGILTPFGEVEGGEGVINNRSMSNYSLRNMASAANVAGGGRSFSAGDGTIKLSPESIAMINDKKVYVSEQDITNTQNKVKIYETNATY